MSKTVKMDLFLAKIQEIISEKPTYKLGKDGSNGLCDCIGLIIGGLRRAGGKWSGGHGTNHAVRYQMQAPLTKPRLELGELLYKYRDAGSPDNKLPASYKNHPDQRDYYHVGVIISVNPLKIAHCTSSSGFSGIKIDTKLGTQWRLGGRVKGLDYDHIQEELPMEKIGEAIVRLPKGGSGKTVRLRSGPSKSANVRFEVPVGSVVSIFSQREGWWEIGYDGVTGWMMSSFLESSDTMVSDKKAEVVTITLSKAAAEYLLEVLKGVL